jgi:hypothetical protein
MVRLHYRQVGHKTLTVLEFWAIETVINFSTSSIKFSMLHRTKQRFTAELV